MGVSRLYRTNTPYNSADLAGIDSVQSADVMYFAHIAYPPQKLTRTGHTSWAFEPVTFGPKLPAPTGVSVVATIPNKDATNQDGSVKSNSQYYPRPKTYAVSAVGEDGQVSRLSTGATVSNDLGLKGNYNTVTWNAVAGAEYYIVFGIGNNSSSYGYMGRAEGTTFTDDDGGIAPDYADGPRQGENPFVGAGNYPSTVTFHQQRLLWARTASEPSAVWGSQSADFENMDKSQPTKADDALTFSIVSERVNAVQQLVSMKSLLALTSDAIFGITGGGVGTALTATQIVSERQSGAGSDRLEPLAIDDTLFFKPNQGSAIRTLGYTFETDGYRSNDITIFSPHFFNSYGIIAWAFQREPYSVIWAVRSDGTLLAFTWQQEQQVWGWTMCEIDGTVQDVAVVTEGGMDRVYLAVKRTLNGKTDVFIERMALPLQVPEDLIDSCYLDCAVTRKLTPASAVVDRLWHLEGETVTAYADGYVYTGLVVERGRITLPNAVGTATVGIPYQGEIETLPLALMGKEGTANVDRQMIAGVTVRVEKTRGISVGVGGEVFEVKQRDDEELGEAIRLKTQDYEVNTSAKWGEGAGVIVRQTYPLPATISALFVRPKVTR